MATNASPFSLYTCNITHFPPSNVIITPPIIPHHPTYPHLSHSITLQHSHHLTPHSVKLHSTQIHCAIQFLHSGAPQSCTTLSYLSCAEQQQRKTVPFTNFLKFLSHKELEDEYEFNLFMPRDLWLENKRCNKCKTNNLRALAFVPVSRTAHLLKCDTVHVSIFSTVFASQCFCSPENGETFS